MCGKTETLFSIKVNNHKKCNNIIKRSLHYYYLHELLKTILPVSKRFFTIIDIHGFSSWNEKVILKLEFLTQNFSKQILLKINYCIKNKVLFFDKITKISVEIYEDKKMQFQFICISTC